MDASLISGDKKEDHHSNTHTFHGKRHLNVTCIITLLGHIRIIDGTVVGAMTQRCKNECQYLDHPAKKT